MLIKILLLASLSALANGQTTEDCNLIYKQCYQDAFQRAFEQRYQAPKAKQQKIHQRPTPRPVESQNDVSDSQGSDAEGNCLAEHNKLRAKHGVPPLKRPSGELQSYANKRGHELASTDKFAHPANSKYGENLFMGGGKDFNCVDAVGSWYDEIKDFNFNNPTFSSGTGHFTQVVWKDAKEVACSINKSPKTGYTYIVVSI